MKLHTLSMEFQSAAPLEETGVEGYEQGVTKRRRLSWLTNSALVYEPKCGGIGGGGGDLRGFSQ